MFACLADVFVSPEPVLPGVAHTDAVAAFDRWLAQAPGLNRLGLRLLLHVLEVGPLARGHTGRLRRLDRPERVRYLCSVEASRHSAVRQVTKLMRGLAMFCYYGDDAVMLGLGYDAEANRLRGVALRRREGRP